MLVADMPLVTVKSRHQVTIPAKLREKLPVAEGDILEMSVQGGAFLMTPKAVTNRLVVAEVKLTETADSRMTAMDALVDRFRALPTQDPRNIDDILYDDNGLPQ